MTPPMPDDEKAIARTWSSYWRSHSARAAEWDSLSHLIFLTLRRETGGFAGKAVLETGCGTGRISSRIAREGARVTCLDVAPEALELARQELEGVASARLVLGSVLALPRDAAFDVVWSAGLLEHFSVADQRKALEESLSVLSPGGNVIALTPYAGSFVYRAAKAFLERIGKWPYGRECPVATLRDALPEGAWLRKEWTIAFLPFCLDAWKWAPLLEPPCRGLGRAMRGLLGDRGFAGLDRLLSRLLGGYLLVSVVAPGARPAVSGE